MNNRLADLILELEQQLLTMAARRDVKLLQQILDEQFIEVTSVGDVYNKNDIILMLSKQNNYHYQLSQPVFQMLTKTTVLLVYQVTKHDLEKNIKIDSMRSSVWRKRDDQWQMVFHQGTLRS